MVDLVTSDSSTQFTPEQLVIDNKSQMVSKNASSQAFYAAALASPYKDAQGVVDLYRKIKTDIETNGQSPDYDAVQKLVNTDSDIANRKSMTGVLSNPNIPQAEKEAMVHQYLKDRETDVNMTDEYIQRMYASEETTNAEDAAHKKYDASYVFDRMKYYEDTQAATNHLMAENDLSIKGQLLGFGEMVLPFMEGYSVEKAKESVFGEDNAWDTVKNIVLYGENKKALRDALNRMPYDQRAEATKKLLEGIGSLPGGDMKKMSLVQDLIENPDYSTWHRGLDDAMGLLDLALVGSTLKNVVKAAGRAKFVASLLPERSVLNISSEANKTIATKLAADALNSNTEELAGALGGTKRDIATTAILPKWDTSVIRDMPSDVVDEMTRIESTANSISEQVATHGINYTLTEKQAVMDAINESLGAVDGMKLHLNKSTMAQNSLESLQAGENMERYSGIAMYGSTVKNGFSTVYKALDGVSKNFKDLENVVLYKKNLKTGQFDIVSDIEAEAGKKGSYFVGYKFDHIYNPMDAAIYGEDAVSKLGATKYGGYLFDVVSRFDRSISQASLRAADQASAIEKRLLDVVGRDLRSISNKSKTKVFYALEEGARQNEIFDVPYLRNKLGLDDKEIKAYYSYRKISDVVWSLTNNDLVKNLRSNGMKELTTAGTEEKLYARELDNTYAKSSVKEVYNPVSGTIEKLDTQLLDNGGVTVGRLSRAMKVGNRSVDYVMIDGKASRLGPVGDHVLPYIKGYFQRTYKEFYFVDKIPPEMYVNGTKITDRATLIRDHGSTIAAYATRTEADKIAKELSATTGEEHIARRGAEYENFYEKDYRLYQTALSNTKRRGTHLEGYGERGLANIEDPIESLYRSVRAVSSRLSYDDLLQSLKNRWMNSYSHMVPEINGLKKFPDDPRVLIKQAGNAVDYNNAKALLEHISTLSRAPAKTDKMWQSFMMDLSESLEHIVPESVAVGIKKAGQVSPASALRKLPSVFFIALRPLRQAIVQSMQLMQYSFMDPRYIFSGQFTRDLMSMSLARASFSNPAMYARMRNIGAKLMRVDAKEFDAITDTFINKSGLPYSIDSNFYVEGLVKDIHETTLLSPGKRAAAAVFNTGRKVAQYSKAAGFDVGEFMNITGSWLIARRKWMAANPGIAAKWSEKAFSDQIAASAREISYAMSTPGILKYQRGLLAIPLQFVAVPHKAMLSMLPEALGGSKAFSKGDKIAIAAANLMYFGGAGFGINKVVDYIQDEIGVDLPDDVDMALRGGLVDISLNTLIRTMADEKNDGTSIKFSDSFAPMNNGLFFQDVMSKLLFDDWRQAVFGPSYSIVGFQNSRFSRAYDDIAAITSMPDVSSPEKIKLSMFAVANLASGVSDYMKYRYAMHTGKLVSARGDDVLNITRSEAIAKLFGFGTYKEEDAYTYLKDSFDEEKALKDYAKNHYEAVERAYKLYGEGDRPTYEMHLMAWQSIMSSLEPHERKQVSKYIEQLAHQKFSSTGDSLINRMLQSASNGGEVRQEVISNVMRTKALTDGQKNTILQMLDESMNGDLLNAK